VVKCRKGQAWYVPSYLGVCSFIIPCVMEGWGARVRHYAG